MLKRNFISLLGLWSQNEINNAFLNQQTMEEKKPTEEKKKGLLGKIKDATDDKEEQLAILSTFVRLGILIWSGGILTLKYVDLPQLQIPKQDLDPTFIASVFTEALTQLLEFRRLRKVQ